MEGSGRAVKRGNSDILHATEIRYEDLVVRAREALGLPCIDHLTKTVSRPKPLWKWVSVELEVAHGPQEARKERARCILLDDVNSAKGSASSNPLGPLPILDMSRSTFDHSSGTSGLFDKRRREYIRSRKCLTDELNEEVSVYCLAQGLVAIFA